MTALVEARGLFKSYGSVEVLKGIDFEVGSGETLAMIGPNGAGKTTLFRCVTGEAPVNAGLIRHRGEDVTGTSAFERVRRGMGRTFQVARIFPEFTTLENVVVAVERHRAVTRGRASERWWRHAPDPDVAEEARRWLAEVDLHAREDLEARHLAHGDKKRLELACVLALEPEILMLDEPTAGMSRTERLATIDLLARLKADRGLTMMMTEHDMDVVFGLADRLMVMNYGEIIAAGAPEEVRRDPVVRQVYLGEDEPLHA